MYIMEQYIILLFNFLSIHCDINKNKNKPFIHTCTVIVINFILQRFKICEALSNITNKPVYVL